MLSETTPFRCRSPDGVPVRAYQLAHPYPERIRSRVGLEALEAAVFRKHNKGQSEDSDERYDRYDDGGNEGFRAVTELWHDASFVCG